MCNEPSSTSDNLLSNLEGSKRVDVEVLCIGICNLSKELVSLLTTRKEMKATDAKNVMKEGHAHLQTSKIILRVRNLILRVCMNCHPLRLQVVCLSFHLHYEAYQLY